VTVFATQKIFGFGRAREGVTWADMAPVMQPEAAHVWSLYARGIVRDAWVRTDAPGAVYVLESSPAQARRALDQQPLTRGGLVSFELVPVGPFTPLSMLFGTQREPIPAAGCRRSRRGGRSQRILALDRLCDGITREDLDPLLADETRLAWSLWKGGVIRETYLRTDRPGALLVLEAEDASDAQRILNRLPLANRGLIEFECVPVAAFLGFDALLEGALND
jgi:hypothetical protein